MTGSLDDGKELIVLTKYFSPSPYAPAQFVNDTADNLHTNVSRMRVLTSLTGPSLPRCPVYRFASSSQEFVGLVVQPADVQGLMQALLTLQADHQLLLAMSDQSQAPYEAQSGRQRFTQGYLSLIQKCKMI